MRKQSIKPNAQVKKYEKSRKKVNIKNIAL
jgi:hypothetical protein